MPERARLRILTCGSVDDGKSTLIGRLLHDLGTLATDQVTALQRDSLRYGTTGGGVDYALLLDGLEAEREQGITIDVAYRYFATPRRSFTVIDSPGHEQFTRNMATGASNADVAVVLVDARKGILPQTRRHTSILSLLRIRHVVLAVNKMDLVDWSQERFEQIAAEYKALVAHLDVPCDTGLKSRRHPALGPVGRQCRVQKRQHGLGSGPITDWIPGND